MKAYFVKYNVQTRPGDTTEYSNNWKAAGPFSTRSSAEQFSIHLASRFPLLACRIEETEIEA